MEKSYRIITKKPLRGMYLMPPLALRATRAPLPTATHSHLSTGYHRRASRAIGLDTSHSPKRVKKKCRPPRRWGATRPYHSIIPYSGSEWGRGGRGLGRDLENPVAGLTPRSGDSAFHRGLLGGALCTGAGRRGARGRSSSLAKDCLLRGKLFDLMYLY